LSGQDRTRLLGIVVAGIIVALIGLLDDVGRIPTRVEVSALLLPALLVVLLGQRVGFVPIAIISFPLTLFYLVGGASAMNLVDGMNGLAGGIGAIASAACFLLSWGQGDIGGAVLSLALLGALVGFLPHNFPRGKVFLGDNGSLFVGFVLAALMVRISSRPYHLGALLAPLLILGVPIGDTTLAILRRMFQGGGVLSGDRRHTYDLLRERVGDVSTVLIMWVIAASGGVMGLLVYRLGESNAFLALAVFVVWYALFFSLAAGLGVFRGALPQVLRSARDGPEGGVSIDPSLRSG
jgi:UDP-GlcNAc:undecaprenyl-phosphate GlcNAc-1-phosphate transferase